jgi:hypothetical protein
MAYDRRVLSCAESSPIRELECASMLFVRLWATARTDGVSASWNEPCAFLLLEAGEVGEAREAGEMRVGEMRGDGEMCGVGEMRGVGEVREVGEVRDETRDVGEMLDGGEARRAAGEGCGFGLLSARGAAWS